MQMYPWNFELETEYRLEEDKIIFAYSMSITGMKRFLAWDFIRDTAAHSVQSMHRLIIESSLKR